MAEQKWLKARGKYVRKRLPDGRLGYEHRVVYEEHNGKIPKGYCIDHKNGNKSDNRPENLQAVPSNVNTWLNWNYYDNKKTRAARRNGTLIAPGKRVKK
jgi:hypothetical protein